MYYIITIVYSNDEWIVDKIFEDFDVDEYLLILAREGNDTILRSRSLHCVRTFYKIFVLHDMHMILESLESDFKRALIDTKISQIACWEPKNTIHCNGIV